MPYRRDLNTLKWES